VLVDDKPREAELCEGVEEEEMTEEQIIGQVRAAFKEMMLVDGVFGTKPGRDGEKLLWEKHFYPKLQWRLEALRKKSKL